MLDAPPDLHPDYGPVVPLARLTAATGASAAAAAHRAQVPVFLWKKPGGRQHVRYVRASDAAAVRAEVATPVRRGGPRGRLPAPDAEVA